MQASDRLKTVLGLGGVVALFPVLKDWSTDELRALLRDIEEYASVSHKAIDRAWETVALSPNVFLSEALSKTVDKYRDEKKIEVMQIMSEISSVAMFYLNQRGIKIPE